MERGTNDITNGLREFFLKGKGLTDIPEVEYIQRKYPMS